MPHYDARSLGIRISPHHVASKTALRLSLYDNTEQESAKEYLGTELQSS